MQFTHILFATATAALQSSAVLGTSSQFQPELPATHTHYHGHMILTGSHPNLTATVAPEPSQSGGIFPIIGYEEVLPDSNTPSNFGINQTWAHHHVLGQMTLFLEPGRLTAAYGVFKCQFFCNGISNCLSFYGRFVNAQQGNKSASFECTRFDELINSHLYVEDDDQSHVHVAGYNRNSKGAIRQ